MARLHVLVSAGMFGPAAALIGQSVPSLSPSPSKQNQEEEECTSNSSYCNLTQFGLGVQNSSTETAIVSLNPRSTNVRMCIVI